MDKIELYRVDLEDITGKIYRGNITPLVYDLLKSSPYLDSLLEELTGIPKEIPKESKPEAPVPSFESWFYTQPIIKEK